MATTSIIGSTRGWVYASMALRVASSAEATTSTTTATTPSCASARTTTGANSVMRLHITRNGRILLMAVESVAAIGVELMAGANPVGDMVASLLAKSLRIGGRIPLIPTRLG